MGPERVSLKTLLEGAAVVLLLEALLIGLGPATQGGGLWVLGLFRAIQGLALVFILVRRGPGWAALGLARADLKKGLIHGLIWSAGFGVLAGAGLLALHVAGLDPLRFFRMRPPTGFQSLLALLVVGGVIGPVVEEIFFRGLIFGYLRKWGAVAAILGSALVFLLPHAAYRDIGPTQMAGGLVFALAYEIEGSLLAPMLIHVLGNLALFGLGMLG